MLVLRVTKQTGPLTFYQALKTSMTWMTENLKRQITLLVATLAISSARVMLTLKSCLTSKCGTLCSALIGC